MRFFAIFTVVAAGVMALAGAIPEAAMKRDVATIQNAFSTLENKVDTIMPKFNGCNNDDCTTEVVVELVAVISDCTNVLGSVNGGIGTLALASVVAEVFTVSFGKSSGLHFTYMLLQKITVGLGNHKNQCGSGCPNILSIYAQIDVALSVCLNLCFQLCLGLSGLVSLL